MILETIRLDIYLDIFDIHFTEFIREWNVLVLERQNVGNVRIRYEVYYHEKGMTENKNLLAEVEVTSVNKDQIEVRIALVELDRGYSYDFVPALGQFIDRKWHDNLVLDDYDNWDLRKGLEYLKLTLLEKYGFNNLDEMSSLIKLPEGTDEKRAALAAYMHENLRLSLLEELQERLQPIDTLPGYASTSVEIIDDAHSIDQSTIIEEKNTSKETTPPWEQIHDDLWDRTALKMWHEGYSNREIGESVNVSPATVTNRLSELRKQYGLEIVPLKNEIRRRLIKKTHDTG